MWLTCTASKPPGCLVAQGGVSNYVRMAKWSNVSVRIIHAKRPKFDSRSMHFFLAHIILYEIILNIRSPSGTEWGLNGDSHYNPLDPPRGTPSGLPGLLGL